MLEKDSLGAFQHLRPHRDSDGKRQSAAAQERILGQNDTVCSIKLHCLKTLRGFKGSSGMATEWMVFLHQYKQALSFQQSTGTLTHRQDQTARASLSICTLQELQMALRGRLHNPRCPLSTGSASGLRSRSLIGGYFPTRPEPGRSAGRRV